MKNNFLCLYISDLHVNKKKKIKSLLKKKNNSLLIEKFFQDQVQDLISTIPAHDSEQTRIFIVGDVASNFELFKCFFNFYCQKIKIKTYFILGNHEFKALFYQKKDNYLQIVDRYQKFLSSIGIELLEDELLVENIKQQKTLKFNISEILKLKPEQIKNIFVNASFGVLGSFSGSETLSQVHCLLRKVVPDVKLVFATHFPFKTWLQDQINHHWVYLYGHSHHNVKQGTFCYADNQIGVQKKLKFKSFNLAFN